MRFTPGPASRQSGGHKPDRRNEPGKAVLSRRNGGLLFDAARPANSDSKFAIIIPYCTAGGRLRGSAATGRGERLFVDSLHKQEEGR
jgi:hypothetical protein